MKKQTILLALFAVLAVALAGCGGGESAGGAAAAGEELFNQSVIDSTPGCVTCHSLEPGEVIVGPSLAGFGEEAEEEGEAEGMSAEEFVRQSIVEPDAVLSEGYDAGIMPGNYEDVLSQEQLDNLVEFLLSLE
jgi:mono/diheme cytochrome c family protein